MKFPWLSEPDWATHMQWSWQPIQKADSRSWSARYACHPVDLARSSPIYFKSGNVVTVASWPLLSSESTVRLFWSRCVAKQTRNCWRWDVWELQHYVLQLWQQDDVAGTVSDTSFCNATIHTLWLVTFLLPGKVLIVWVAFRLSFPRFRAHVQICKCRQGHWCCMITLANLPNESVSLLINSCQQFVKVSGPYLFQLEHRQWRLPWHMAVCLNNIS